MKRALLIAGAMVLVLACPSAAVEIVDAFGQTVDASLDEAVSAARELRMPNLEATYDPQKSVQILEGIVARNPNYYRAQYNLALSLLELQPDKPDTYFPVFAKAIELQEHSAVEDGSIYNTVGWLKLNMRDYAEAEGLFQSALKLEASNTDWTNSAATYNLGRLYFETTDFDRSLTFLEKAETLYGNPAAIALKDVVEKSMDPDAPISPIATPFP